MKIATYIIIGATLAFTACAPNGTLGNGGSPVPPPDFPISTPVGGQICGGFTATPQSCPVGQYCHRDISAMCGAADAPGECRTPPQICTQEYRPVCGCDGQTYSNECVANSRGVSAASMGPCP